jgi:hypothetical protein
LPPQGSSRARSSRRRRIVAIVEEADVGEELVGVDAAACGFSFGELRTKRILRKRRRDPARTSADAATSAAREGTRGERAGPRGTENLQPSASIEGDDRPVA